MRPHPLLALCTATTAVALATTGALDQSALAASKAGRAHPHHHLVHLDLRQLTHRAPRPTPETRLSGVMPLTFAVTGGPALGGYVPPAVRRARLEAKRHAHALAVAREHAAMERRNAAAAVRHHARLLAARHAKLLAAQRQHAAAVAAARRQHVYAPAGGVWAELRQCESGGNYAEDTGNGYYGAYQFLPSTWWALGFSGMPNQASPAVQDEAARMLLQRQGWGAWPACSAALGL